MRCLSNRLTDDCHRSFPFPARKISFDTTLPHRLWFTNLATGLFDVAREDELEFERCPLFGMRGRTNQEDGKPYRAAASLYAGALFVRSSKAQSAARQEISFWKVFHSE